MARPHRAPLLDETVASLPLEIEPQPTDSTCGPTCLHAVLRFYGATAPLEEVIKSTPTLAGEDDGTLGVLLGHEALRRGFTAQLHTFNLRIFDPTWFDTEGKADPVQLHDKLTHQATLKAGSDPRFDVASQAYMNFVAAGGVVRFHDLTGRWIAGQLRAGRPLLTGLSATYLYRCAREWSKINDHDDLRGEPTGHFVVLKGYDPETRLVTIADPLADNPGFRRAHYSVPMHRLLPAILLGVLTYDANILVIAPRAPAC